MAKINNSAVIQKLIDELELYPGKDIIPSEVADKILPVFQVNSQEMNVTAVNETANLIRSGAQGGAGSTTLYAVPATGNFYLTNALVDYYANSGTATNVQVELIATISGVACNLLHLRGGYEANKFAYGSQELSLNNPILIDQSTNIIITVTGASCTAEATIIGYNTA